MRDSWTKWRRADRPLGTPALRRGRGAAGEGARLRQQQPLPRGDRVVEVHGVRQHPVATRACASAGRHLRGTHGGADENPSVAKASMAWLSARGHGSGASATRRRAPAGLSRHPLPQVDPPTTRYSAPGPPNRGAEADRPFGPFDVGHRGTWRMPSSSGRAATRGPWRTGARTAGPQRSRWRSCGRRAAVRARCRPPR